MFMGHIGVPTKKLVKGNACFIFYFSVLCSACYASSFVYNCFQLVQGGACYQIIASHAFAEKHF